MLKYLHKILFRILHKLSDDDQLHLFLEKKIFAFPKKIKLFFYYLFNLKHFTEPIIGYYETRNFTNYLKA